MKMVVGGVFIHKTLFMAVCNPIGDLCLITQYFTRVFISRSDAVKQQSFEVYLIGFRFHQGGHGRSGVNLHPSVDTISTVINQKRAFVPTGDNY